MNGSKMTDMFKKIYKEHRELGEKYRKATANDDSVLAEQIIKEAGELLKPLGDDDTDLYRLYDMYADAWDKGNDVINVSDAMFEKARTELIRLFTDNGITRFTYSSQSTGLMNDMWDFVQAGWKVMEMTKVDNGTRPAFLLARM